MNENKEDDFECERPQWVDDVMGRLFAENMAGTVSIDPIASSIRGLSLLEIDPCPDPIISYFKEDLMFTWSSPKGTMSLLIGSKAGEYFAWLSRNGYVSKKWESVTISEVRKMFIGLFCTIDVRWNPKP